MKALENACRDAANCLAAGAPLDVQLLTQLFCHASLHMFAVADPQAVQAEVQALQASGAMAPDAPPRPAPQYNNVMLDLETLGLEPGCKVMSIGATVFGPGGTGSVFYRAIQRENQFGLVEDPETLAWWAGQSPEARAALFDNPDAVPLYQALIDFSQWLRQQGAKARVWGNGADFDLPILLAAYKAASIRKPWTPFVGRCYRTLKNQNEWAKSQFKRVGTHHNALDDAVSQAEHARIIMNARNLWE